ncbi:E3 ubiquitin-protein ligase SINA-like 10 isoform X3 [Phoenix dactylifera]|uniref:E3 ubiquitin-protein ligase SINA-like 10 isoform X3 n=1 Tax=Phoenix dactylifera TaxID=42345 RepID=A0A8B7D3D9_PHODC|nr:E3 ubiquitin-protein ligase SINA-like 10 isoform X3 [Phoenix dactylifera]
MARFSLEDEEEEMGDGRRKKRSGGAEEIDRRSPKKGKKSKTKGKREMGNEVEGEEEAEVAAGEEEGGEGGEVEEEEKKEAEQGDGGISSGKENGDGISVRIDPDVLDCCICYEPLRPPLLQGDDGHLFLLLNNRDVAMGYALSIACIRPDTPEGNFSYELTATGEESSVLLKACTTNIKEWKGVHPTKAFLLVPHDFFYSSGIMLLDVCIQKSNLVL